MVRNVARCLIWIVLVSVVACSRGATGPAEGGPGTGGGSFAYLTLTDGTRVIRWLSPDGKQVVYFRTDMKWVCEKSGDDVKCGPRESLAPAPEITVKITPAAVGAGSGVQFESCPCTEKLCIPMCVNPSVLPGLPDPKAGGVPPKP